MMSTVNDLIRKATATPAPKELLIEEREIETVVNHLSNTSDTARTVIERQLRIGRVKLYNIPIRVIGQPKEK